MTATDEKKLLRDIHSIAQSLKEIAKVAKQYQIDISEEPKAIDTDEKDEWI